MLKIIDNAYNEVQIKAQIELLINELSKCAPHPDSIDHKTKPDSLTLERSLGSAFSHTANDCERLIDTLDQKIEMISTALKNNRPKQPFALGQHHVIANDFNCLGATGSNYQTMMNAFLADLPNRLHLEKWITQETRRLYGLRKQALTLAPMPKAA